MNLDFLQELLKARHSNKAIFPPKQKVMNFANELIELLFPHYCGEYEYFTTSEVRGKFDLIKRDLRKILILQQPSQEKHIDKVIKKFFAQVPHIYQKLKMDALAIFEGDPAAKSIDEVISAYPGFFAIYTYRIAHEFYLMSIPVFPRMLSEYAHFRTGIDIHPGAVIGDSFFIDHGTGIVIGETTHIGNNVKLYQGVTLGALSVSKKLDTKKRHPTIEDNVIVYSNATILGGETVVGQNSVIGGNVWLTKSVHPQSVVYQKSETNLIIKNNGSKPINFII